MKLKVGNFKIDSKTLVELRMVGIIPRLYVHEKFQTSLKWIIWIVSTLSFITIFIIIDNYYVSVGIGILLFVFSFIFDRAIIKYTTFIVQPYPEFTIDYSQWVNVMTVSDSDYKKVVNVVGFVYKDMEYGKKFFKYIKDWNFGNIADKDGNIILSIVEETDGSFTFYIYANPNRKNLKKMYRVAELTNFLTKSKKGKVQEQLVMQMSYWHTLHYTDDKHIRDFLKNQPSNECFMFVPSQKTERGYEIDFESRIMLRGYKYAKRKDLHKYSNENQLTKMAKKWKDNEA